METFEKKNAPQENFAASILKKAGHFKYLPGSQYATRSFLACPIPYITDSRDLTSSTNLATSGLRNRKSELTILASSVPTVAVVWSPCWNLKAL